MTKKETEILHESVHDTTWKLESLELIRVVSWTYLCTVVLYLGFPATFHFFSYSIYLQTLYSTAARTKLNVCSWAVGWSVDFFYRTEQVK